MKSSFCSRSSVSLMPPEATSKRSASTPEISEAYSPWMYSSFRPSRLLTSASSSLETPMTSLLPGSRNSTGGEGLLGADAQRAARAHVGRNEAGGVARLGEGGLGEGAGEDHGEQREGDAKGGERFHGELLGGVTGMTRGRGAAPQRESADLPGMADGFGRSARGQGAASSNVFSTESTYGCGKPCAFMP